MARKRNASKELKFICAQPNEFYYVWQVHMWLESLKKIGHSDKAIVLIAVFEENKVLNPKWKEISELYPESKFEYYTDTDNIYPLLFTYIPVLRPYILSKYFKEHPEMSDKAIFYCDSDILFTEKFDIQRFVEDDICYLSDTINYIGAEYFDSRIKNVIPSKLEEYKSRDILNEVASLVGISRKVCEANEYDSGGAQYLLKNIDYLFWDKVMNDCILIRKYLQEINKEFFRDENSGFQTWCADMWAVLWNLWLRDKKVFVIRDLDFAWAYDPIEKLEDCTIYHNAGITDIIQDGYPAFYKGKYSLGENPFKDQHIQDILNNEISKKHCTWYYTNTLVELYNKYTLTYALLL